jgi:hypothetical protein
MSDINEIAIIAKTGPDCGNHKIPVRTYYNLLVVYNLR